MQECDNMQYLLGSLCTVVFFALVLGAYYLGMKRSNPTKQPVDADEQRKQEMLRKDFDEMMNYSVEKAYGGGKR